MIGFLLTFCLYVTIVFLAIIPAFGISYTGAEESPIYVLTVLGTNALAICYVVFQALFHHKQAKGSIGFYLLPLLILFLYVIEHLQADPILFRLFRIGNYYRNILLSVRPVRPYC